MLSSFRWACTCSPPLSSPPQGWLLAIFNLLLNKAR